MRKMITLIAAVGVMAVGTPLLAHHAFGGEFDPNRPVLLKGKVIKLEWVNPHAWIHVEVPKDDGPQPCQFTPTWSGGSWRAEAAPRTPLLRRASPRTRRQP